jgi:hypothetical protein
MSTFLRLLAVFLLAGWNGLNSLPAVSQQENPDKNQARTQESSPEEISKQRYAEADADSDGSISRDEFIAYAKAKLPDFPLIDALTSILDADKDNEISPEEFALRQQVAQNLISAYEARMAEMAKPQEFADRFNERFAGQKPLVGDVVEDLIAFDENGKELDFAELRGKYTVINFGCLT